MASTAARTVAVVGAGPERRKFGNKSVRAHAAAGYTVYPIHPTADRVEGLPVFKSVKDVPVEKLDRVTIYLPPAVGTDRSTRHRGQVAGRGLVQPRRGWPRGPGRGEDGSDLNVIAGCSIVDLGMSPAMFPDT